MSSIVLIFKRWHGINIHQNFSYCQSLQGTFFAMQVGVQIVFLLGVNQEKKKVQDTNLFRPEPTNINSNSLPSGTVYLGIIKPK
jgi:hypothetical protein